MSAALVEVTRGLAVESRHHGSVAVCDADGALVFNVGDVERAVFPRSGVKALQALPLIESGAADRYGLTDSEIALACASHAGEPEHIATAAGVLARAGLDAHALECGAHWPLSEASARALAASGAGPTALHNNCSGKHAGFLCLACAIDVDPIGYVAEDHPVQRAVSAAIEETTGTRLSEAASGVDGCGIPAFAIPLKNLAIAFARLGTGAGFAPERAAAAKRLREAVWSAPFQVAGSGRFDTEAMQLAPRRVFTKMGAEGVHLAALPELGLGVALKIDDGAGRAAETAMAAVIRRLLAVEGDFAAWLDARTYRRLHNWSGVEVGAIRAGEALSS
ncbi:asparaginase [Hansschlegelia quercus]|uniref:Asparaginase n=1 Tax=Hansschlegelia quercus TaxID=2528245 RepID=A0A4Q9GNS1_9HYPH|nr:asparaginase [Hansschlegelia quercus]TBN54835.1 asparaginase [Hansschlegelia quercus]